MNRAEIDRLLQGERSFVQVWVVTEEVEYDDDEPNIFLDRTFKDKRNMLMQVEAFQANNRKFTVKLRESTIREYEVDPETGMPLHEALNLATHLLYNRWQDGKLDELQFDELCNWIQGES